MSGTLHPLAIETLRTEAPHEKGVIENFLQSHTFPLVEGPHVTFVFRGKVDQVNLRHWIYGLPFAQPLHRIDDTDLWYIVQELPEGSRVEYKYEVIKGDQRRWIRDPLNPHLARDPFGANSVCQAEGYKRPDWTLHDPESREGMIQEIPVSSAVFNESRPVLLYLPARMRSTRRYPLLVMHDGVDFLRYADIKIVLDNMIHRQEIPPMIVALTHSPRRLVEYAADENHAKFLVEELLPHLETTFPLLEGARNRGIVGASFGGVAALHAGWKYPSAFGKMGLLSGSFAFTDIGESERPPAFEPVVEFVNTFRQNPGLPAEKIFISCGVYESLIYENRSLVPLLQETDANVRWVEVRDGHNWENWRDRMREALSFLFPGPLWMVYE